MSTFLTVKEKGLENILIKNSPWDTSAKTIHGYVVLDDDTTILVGNLLTGEAIGVTITLPCFFERAGVEGGATYPFEVVADKDGANPIVLLSHEDCYITIDPVASL